MKKLIVVLLCFSCIGISGFSQNPWELTGEYQHGFGNHYNVNSLGPGYEVYSNKSSWSLGITYTFSSLGVKGNNAKGCGIGLYAGYRYGLSYGISGDLFGGIRTSFTFSKDAQGKKYSIFTPSIESGYHYTSQDFGRGGVFTPFASFGYDIKLNPDVSSKASHEGFIVAPGISIGYRF